MKKIYAYSIRITIIYFLLGIIWISTSDYFLDLSIADKENLTRFQSYKGWFYVTVTSLMLYIISSGYERVLKKHIKKLIQANTDLKVFLYKASHDLKGPIASILGLTNLFKIENPQLKDLTIIEKIEESSFRSDFIIKDLVKLADLLDKDKTPTLISLESIFDQIVESFRYSNKFKPEINITRDVRVDRFYSDRHLVELAIEKILENSFSYQNPGTQKKRVNFTSRSNGTYVFIEIEDNGIGIEAEQINKVFDMFFRGSEYSSGSGLGLYFAKLAVEKLNGQIKIFSIPNMGTKLTLTLPHLKSKKAG